MATTESRIEVLLFLVARGDIYRNITWPSTAASAQKKATRRPPFLIGGSVIAAASKDSRGPIWKPRSARSARGDTVNTASRLESFDKDAFAPDSTLRLLGDEFESELMGEFYLKGKVEPTRIYRVHGRKNEDAVRPGKRAA